ncbi:MAG: LamG domain-containing protein [Anaerohalosphaeraceae bacterium]
MNERYDILDQAVKAFSESSVPAGPSDGLIRQTLDRIEKQQTTIPLMERMINMKPIGKFAAAAIVIMGVSILFLFNSGPGSIALADVLDKMMQITTFSYKTRAMLSPLEGAPDSMPPGLESEILFSYDQGALTETFVLDAQGNREKRVSQTYAILSEKSLINLIPEKKQYIRVNITEQRWEEVGKELANPRALLEEFLKHPYIELGKDIIDGLSVVGYESTQINPLKKEHASTIARIWVDVDAQLPVRIEIESFYDDGSLATEMTCFDFNWDVSVDSSIFIPVIPEDYTSLGQVELSGDEKHVIEGFRFFADLAGGRYPSELNLMTLSKEVRDAMVIRHNGEPPQPDPETLQKLVNLEMALNFYNTLIVKNQSPAYYGKTVTPEFPHAVLMRWHLEDETYKVIFGDLTMKEVTEAELQELESAPLNLESYAIKPFPADGATFGADLNTLELSWISGAYAQQHIVYFGDDPEQMEAIIGTKEPLTNELSALKRDRDYYWRVDEVQTDGSVVEGDLWAFNTGRLRGQWMLDEGSGQTAYDSSPNEADGVITNTDPQQWTPEGLYFDGVDDYVSVPALNLNSNTVTMAGWFKRDGEQPEHTTGLIFCRSDRTGAGLSLGHKGQQWVANNCLGYNWNNNPSTWLWTTDLLLPDNEWVFAALVLEPDKATLYLGQDGQLVSAVNHTPHRFEEFEGQIRIGDDNHPGPPEMKRHFKGWIKNVSIYDYALSQSEIENISK